MIVLSSIKNKLRSLAYIVFTKIVIPLIIVFTYMYVTVAYIIYVDSHDISKYIVYVIMAVLVATALAFYFIFFDP